MSNRLMQYLPELYHDIVDFLELTKTEEIEITSVEQAVDQLFDNQFVLSSDERAIRRRERMLRIQADPSLESLDFRKRRVINRYSTKPPFTIRYLQERLDFLVGENRAITSVDVQNFILTVTASIDDAAVFREVEHTVKTIKPANMIYIQETAVADTITLKEHISLQTMTRNTRLSTTWRLGRTPFSELGEEVVIK